MECYRPIHAGIRGNTGGKYKHFSIFLIMTCCVIIIIVNLHVGKLRSIECLEEKTFLHMYTEDNICTDIDKTQQFY